jgi:hypothetical protein
MITGCGQSDQTTDKITADEVKQEIKEAANATASMTKQEMDAFVVQMEAQLKNFDEKIARLQARAETLAGEAKESVDRKIETLVEKRENAYEKLQSLKSASAGAWEDLKSGLQSAMFELNRAMKEAADGFKS